MNPTFDLLIGLDRIMLGIIAIFIFVIGLRGIVTKRPFIISARWLFYPILVAFLPKIFESFLLDSVTTDLTLMTWLSPLMFGCIILMMWFQTKGYMAFAVTDQSFREALISALHKLNLPFEERLSAMHLTSVEADVQVEVQSWMGVGQIKIKQSRHRSLLTQIVSAMNDHFRTSTAETNVTACLFFTILGIFAVITAIDLEFF